MPARIAGLQPDDHAPCEYAAPGAPEVARAHADLPDMARAAVALAERTDLADCADIGFPGHTFSINDLAALICAQMNRPIRLAGFPWWVMRRAAPVWELGREMSEMRYRYNHAHRIDGTDFAHLVPGFSATPLAEVIASHLPRAVLMAA